MWLVDRLVDGRWEMECGGLVGLYMYIYIAIAILVGYLFGDGYI